MVTCNGCTNMITCAPFSSAHFTDSRLCCSRLEGTGIDCSTLYLWTASLTMEFGNSSVARYIFGFLVFFLYIAIVPFVSLFDGGAKMRNEE